MMQIQASKRSSSDWPDRTAAYAATRQQATRTGKSAKPKRLQNTDALDRGGRRGARPAYEVSPSSRSGGVRPANAGSTVTTGGRHRKWDGALMKERTRCALASLARRHHQCARWLQPIPGRRITQINRSSRTKTKKLDELDFCPVGNRHLRSLAAVCSAE